MGNEDLESGESKVEIISTPECEEWFKCGKRREDVESCCMIPLLFIIVVVVVRTGGKAFCCDALWLPEALLLLPIRL